MEVGVLVFNFVEENTYILWDETNECVIVDAGNFGENEDKLLVQYIEQKGLRPVMAINTHGHFDHVMGVEFVRNHYGVPFAMSSRDNYLLESVKGGAKVYGVTMGNMPSTIDIDLDVTPEIKFGNTTLQIIKTPGHTPGGVSLFDAESRVLVTGDTIFRESIGRTDLEGGDYAQLMCSIESNVITLGDDVAIYPGHSSSTTIGHEVLYNPFVVEVISGAIKP